MFHIEQDDMDFNEPLSAVTHHLLARPLTPLSPVSSCLLYMT